MSEDIQVGNVNKPAARKPLPKKPSVQTSDAVTEAPTAEKSTDADIAALNAKMEDVLKFLQAIDWKMWVYLKANNYID